MQTSIYRMDKRMVLLHSPRSCIQYPVINHNGKEHEKEYIHVYIKLKYFVEQQK